VERLEAVYARVAPPNPGTSPKPARQARADGTLTDHDT
jgi:hypothetical protein